MSDFKDRLLDEFDQLRDRTHKLDDFINHNPKFTEIDSRQRDLLQEQHYVMTRYLDILSLRIELLK